jgi:hypothetical protein
VPIHRPVASPATSRPISLVAPASNRVDRSGAGCALPPAASTPERRRAIFGRRVFGGTDDRPVARRPRRPDRKHQDDTLRPSSSPQCSADGFCHDARPGDGNS